MIEVKGLVKDYGSLAQLPACLLRSGARNSRLPRPNAPASHHDEVDHGFWPTGRTACVGGHDVPPTPVAVKRLIGYLPETPPPTRK